MAEESAIRAIGGVPGFMSPIGLSKDAIVVVDATVMEMHNAVCGANEEDCHYKNANPKRDFGDVIVADISPYCRRRSMSSLWSTSKNDSWY